MHTPNEVVMGTRRPLLLSLLVSLLTGTAPGVLQSQTPQHATITGRVTDAPTGQPLANAQIGALGTNVGAQTNSEGQFTIRVPAGTVTLRVLRVGYGELRRAVTVVAGQSTTENFQMVPVPVSLNPVVTTATGEQRRAEVGNDI